MQTKLYYVTENHGCYVITFTKTVFVGNYVRVHNPQGDERGLDDELILIDSDTRM
jgi:hypothetical protein